MAETHFWWVCAVFNLARNAVRVFGKEGVHVPGEGVLLIKGVKYVMARNGVNYFGRRTMRKASSWAWAKQDVKWVSALPGQQSLTNCAHEKNVRADGVLFTFTKSMGNKFCEGDSEWEGV